MGDVFDDLLADGATKAVEAGQNSSSSAVKTVADVAAGAVKGAAVATAVSEGITWASIGSAVAIAAAAPTAAGGAAAVTALGLGSAIGSAIPIPGLGTLIGVVIGALVAIANLFRGPNYTYLARDPHQAKTLLELIRVSPTLLPHIMSIIVSGDAQTDPAELAGKMAAFFNGKRDPLSTELAERMGGLKGDVDGRKFDENLLVRIVKQLKLLAHEGPRIKWSGPVVYPSSLDMLPALAQKAPDYDAWKEHDGLPLKYIQLTGEWDYRPWRNSVLPNPTLLLGGPLRPDPILDPAFWRQTIRAWADGQDVAPLIKSRDGAQRTLGVLRKALAASKQKLELGRERGEADSIQLGPLANEVRELRLLAGEDGPDPALSSVFGDVAVRQPVIRKRPSLVGLAVLAAGTITLAGILATSEAEARP